MKDKGKGEDYVITSFKLPEWFNFLSFHFSIYCRCHSKVFDLLRIKESLVKSKADEGMMINAALFKLTNPYSRDASALDSIWLIKYELPSWSWDWSSGLFLPTDGIFYCKIQWHPHSSQGQPFTRCKTPAVPVFCSSRLEFQLSFELPGTIPVRSLYASRTRSQISIERPSPCLEINDFTPRIAARPWGAFAWTRKKHPFLWRSPKTMG